MKSVLISIQPKWCELIANGKKTVEVRKSKPKIETPFKVYIYATKQRERLNFHIKGSLYVSKPITGKVIGEFVCDAIIRNCEMANADIAEQQGCIKREKLLKYAGDKEIYGWHISDLVIYDKPKELSEFRTLCKYRNNDGSCQYTKVECDCVKFDYNTDYSVNFAECCDFMIRPPQSWCYVEKLGC